MNRDMMRRVADLIELEDRFNLNHWVVGGDTGDLINKCDTTGCVAGWACAATGQALDDEEDIERAGQLALGLTDAQRERLFAASHGSVWRDHADALGWEPADTFNVNGITTKHYSWDSISPVQASKMLRWIADGEVEL